MSGDALAVVARLTLGAAEVGVLLAGDSARARRRSPSQASGAIGRNDPDYREKLVKFNELLANCPGSTSPGALFSAN